MSRLPKSPAEITAFNEGVKSVLLVAARTAHLIAATTRRPITEGFAIAVLDELAEAGTTLLIRSTNQQAEAPCSP